MNKTLALLALLALGGCATATETYLVDGQQALSIDCSGEALSWDKCYEKAEASCPSKGYTIVGTKGTPAVGEKDRTLGLNVGNYSSRTLTVSCK
ncbi:hypothetical protein NTD86_20880 [Pseudomonas sp. 7P_10.2_Bac1]|uniref:hypothetical protein n=1 Tax=Pseudomonas sp. 7P_10.2_Bac1 TaxID=2971614 RepID=UPI0021CACE7F|nr:hypothetical protein [Pseudomonas sp. 7P_10.2_Bac1]MCU1729432.1 hypothetical protein [Pseudomonas sp. 7P_10.2_Bac1]